ncbi:MAG: hypothetical protein ABSH34_04140 [Verrucomicrobiota bacterium]|jgi:hypothetical protein
MQNSSLTLIVFLLQAGVFAPLAQAATINVALAAHGATIQADSEFTGSPYDPGGKAAASRLIDGIIPSASDLPGTNRWHSDLSTPHPHWVWVRFARPARISQVTLWRSDIGSPVDFAGQSTPDGRSLQTLFRRQAVRLDAAHPSATIEFNPVVTDNFRLLITRSSNGQFTNYTQLSELQVFGEWAGEPVPKPKRIVDRRRGPLHDGPLPPNLEAVVEQDQLTFTSPWLKVAFALDRPTLRFLSLDASGNGKHVKNLLKTPRGADLVAAGWSEPAASPEASFLVSRSSNMVRYAGVRLGDWETMDLTWTVLAKGLRVAIDRTVPSDYLASAASPLRMLFDAAVTPPSPLGRLKSRSELALPVLLHFPDYGSLLVRARGAGSSLRFTGRRDLREVELALQQGWLASGEAATFQQAGHYRVELDMQLTEIYPEKTLVDPDPKLAGVKRGWLNIFGFRPDIGSLGNNSLSDSALFCMYEFADQAFYTPPLFDDFTALDLVRTSLDSYFDGLRGYGDDNAVFVDTDPAMVIAAWDCATGKPDAPWLRRRIADIEKYADHILAADRDGDGLVESSRSGNSGSGPNGSGEWSCNWWDVISFGWNDAYSIALDYRALRCAADLETRLGRAAKGERYRRQAARIKAAYYDTFYNPQTGVLAGWRSKDGKLHDYYFAFVNGIAVAYGLLTPQQGNAIMDRMQAKMREVGYTNFQFGLPGNLVPVARKDYAGGGVLGQPSKDDGSDSFQNYENGGATASFACFYLQALYTLGRKAEADQIFDAMLQGYRDGLFQNGVGSGVDWKRWDGKPCGYEGLLTDTYYALTAFITGRLGRGVPIP